MKTIRYDKRKGDPLANLIWWLQVEFQMGFDYANTNSMERDEARACPASASHVTGLNWKSIALTFFSSDRLGDFVTSCDMGFMIATAAFRRRLEASQLTGAQFPIEVTIGVNQKREPPPKLFLLEAKALKFGPSRWVVEGADNLCPECGKMEMVCHVCGQRNWPACSACEKWTLVNKEAPVYSNPNGFHVDKSFLDEPYVAEGRNWNGSDFFCYDGLTYVTRRAKEWLEQTHTNPIAFKPALLNVEGMEPAMLKKLTSATKG